MAHHDAAAPRPRRIMLPGRGTGEMAYLDYGPEDRPVNAVFLHANGFNAWTYRRILGPLADRWRILSIDQRGHGASSLTANPEGRANWFDLRDDLLAFLAVLELKAVVLSGHSFGGSVSLLATSLSPSICRHLVLFDPVMVPNDRRPKPGANPLAEGTLRRRAVFPSRAEARTSYRGRGAFQTWPDEVLDDYLEAGFRDLPSGEVTLACAPAWEASSYGAQGQDTWGALAAIPCPTEVLRAEKASTCAQTPADVTLPAHVRFTTVPGSTHFLPMERRELVRESLAAAITAT